MQDLLGVLGVNGSHMTEKLYFFDFEPVFQHSPPILLNQHLFQGGLPFPLISQPLRMFFSQDRGRNGDALMKRLFLAGIICVVDASAFWEMYNSGGPVGLVEWCYLWNHLGSHEAS